MCEKYITIGIYLFYSLTAHKLQHCTVCNNKSTVPEFIRLPMIVSLYDYSISDTYSFIFASQSMIVTHSTKANEINEMECSLYPCGLFIGNNIIIARIIVLLQFMQFSHSCI